MGDLAPPAACAAAFFAVGALLLLPFARIGRLDDWSFLRLALPAGLVYTVAYSQYVSALARSEVSAVAPLSALAGPFVVILGRVIYREPLTVEKVAGVLLVAGGAAAVQGLGGRGGLSPVAAAQMAAYALLSAGTRMLDKATALAAPGSSAAYAFTVFAITAICQLGLLAWTGGLAPLGRLVRGHPGTVLTAGACNGGSFLLLLLALGSVPVSVAEPVTTLSLLVSAGIASVWLHERIGARLVPTLAVIAGTWLLVRAGGLLPWLPAR